jgi:hypothetical protein
VHFDTPEAAMRYLAAAYNRDDLAALKKVTNPDRSGRAGGDAYPGSEPAARVV